MAIPKEARQKAKRLRKDIDHHNYLYHSLESPEIEDYEFDDLFRELVALEDRYPGLQTKDSPTLRVGGTRASYLPSAPHNVRMLSIRTAPKTEVEEVREFDSQVRRELGLSERQPPIEYLAELKIDGAAISLRYEKGHLVRGATRGDGTVGEDVTPNVKEIDDVPHLLRASHPPESLEVRGEIFMRRTDFEELNKHLLSTGGKTFQNPRNAAAGSLRQLDSSLIKNRRLSFLTHGFAEAKGWTLPSTQGALLIELSKFGLPVNSKRIVTKGVEKLEKFYTDVRDHRDELDFDIDGVVYKVNQLELQSKLGIRDREPKWALAHKFPPERRSTKVLGIDVQVGRTGALTPVARLESVLVGGVNVTNATLHNLDEIESKGVRVGDTVVVQRAGDVIPEIVFVNFDARPENSSPFVMPSICPICGSKVVRLSKERKLKTKVHIVKEVVYRCVGGLFCPSQRKRAIEHFVNRRALNIDGFGEKLIDQLVDRDLVRTPADVYALTREKLAELDGIRETASLKLSAAIAASKKTTLGRLIYALGIPGVGEATAKELAAKFGNLSMLSKAVPQILRFVPGIGKELANSIHGFFRTSHNTDVIESLKVRGVTWAETTRVDGSLARVPTLASFIDKLEIPDIGKTTASTIQESFSDIHEVISLAGKPTEVKLRNAGMSPASAARVAQAMKAYLEDPEQKKIVEEFDFQLKNFGMHWMTRGELSEAAEMPFSGKKFVLTGSLPNLTKEQAKEKIEAVGGKVTGSVSDKTDYVVAGDSAGVKYDDALRLGKPILSEDQFLRLLSPK